MKKKENNVKNEKMDVKEKEEKIDKKDEKISNKSSEVKTKEKNIFKNLKKVKHKKTIVFVLLIIIVVLFQIFRPKKVEIEAIQTENIEKRSIATSISATGTIQTSNTKNVVSTLSGMKVKTVNVKEGQSINAGDVICTLDTSSIQDNLNTAQNSLSISNAQGALGIKSAERNLNEAIENKNQQVGATQNDVNSALSAYQNAQNELTNAQNQLNSFNSNLASLYGNYSEQSKKFEKVEIEYNKRKTEYETCENSYNAKAAEIATLTPGTNEYNNAQVELQKLEQEMNIAKSKYLAYENTYNLENSNFEPTKSNYENLQNQIATVSANINTLKTNVDSLKQAYDKTVEAYNSTVSTADSTIASMQDNLENSKLSSSLNAQTQKAQVKSYQDQIKDGIIKSDVSGVVTSVSVKAGDIYTGSVIAVIEGTEQVIVESEIDEYDIADVNVGMSVLIKTDATRDQELKGKIIYVSPSSTTSQAGATGLTTTSQNSKATYKVKIELESQNERLRLGMNAKLSIITDSRENVWTVPYDAIYTRDDGSKYIEILKNEETEEKEELDVETGLESSYYVEIKSDKLTDGMKVVLPKNDNQNSMDTIIQMMGSDAGM